MVWVRIHISTQPSSTELTDNTACSCLKKIHLSSTECQMKAKSGSDPLFGGQMLKHYRSLVGLPWGPDVGLRALELVSKGYSY